ncbi:hypothetical protein FKP32DRAFT_1582569 [Trametes sanguinea]|nr:hypothetical protein FKP32DRAFT_1582569 [Trametes sanguinea]
MSLVRAPLILLHAILYQLASTSPNKTPATGRYDSQEAPWIRMAPAVFKMQQPLVWFCTFADILLIISQRFPGSLLHTSLETILCPIAPTSIAFSIRLSLPFLAGLILIAAGTLLRLTCYRALGPFFTFDLALLPKHHLITSGPYHYVRHPAYAGSLLILAGLGLADLSPGSWMAECISARADVASMRSSSLIGGVSMLWAWDVFAVWYAWWLTVGVRRARMEDAVLRQAFGKQWIEYANRVRWWFFPGVL